MKEPNLKGLQHGIDGGITLHQWLSNRYQSKSVNKKRRQLSKRN